MPEKIYFIPWCEAKNYPKLRDVLHHPDADTGSYERWRANAIGVQNFWEARGARVVRVNLEPDEVAAWCVTQGLSYDKEAINAFLTHKGTEILQRGESMDEEDEFED